MSFGHRFIVVSYHFFMGYAILFIEFLCFLLYNMHLKGKKEMKETKLFKVQKMVSEVLNSYFKIWNPSSDTIEMINHEILKYVNEHPDLMKDTFEFKQVVKKHIRNSILYTCSHNPNTNLMEVFFTPYQNNYIELNQFLNLEDCKTNKLLFIQAILNTLLDGTNMSAKYAINSRISMYYQLNRKNYEAQNGIKRPKKFKKYYESKFYGDPKLFQEMLNYLNAKEQEEILNATFMSEGFTHAFRKINNGIKVYFLLTYLNYPKDEKEKFIKEAMEPQNTNIILKKLQTEYASKFHITISQLLGELNKRTKNIDNRYLNVFLGFDIYNLEDDVNTKDTSTIIQKAVSITKKIVNGSLRKGIYHYFLYYPINDINYAIEELKEKRPTYYDLIIKKHGITLEEVHPLTTKENDIYIYGVKMMGKTLARIEKERKTMITKSLKESLSMLYLIKERRRNTTIEELSQKYSISKEKIGTLFANNLLLFGNLIPEMIQELKDLNIPIETSEHYQFYQTYSLQKKC